jgi:hypothetical protein
MLLLLVALRLLLSSAPRYRPLAADARFNSSGLIRTAIVVDLRPVAVHVSPNRPQRARTKNTMTTPETQQQWVTWRHVSQSHKPDILHIAEKLPDGRMGEWIASDVPVKFAKQIVEEHNACARMQDLAAEIAAMRERNKALIALLEHLDSIYGHNFTGNTRACVRNALSGGAQ